MSEIRKGKKFIGGYLDLDVAEYIKSQARYEHFTVSQFLNRRMREEMRKTLANKNQVGKGKLKCKIQHI